MNEAIGAGITDLASVELVKQEPVVEHMKLICLNVRSGGGSRWTAILNFVEGHRADVVVFTEWRRSDAQGAAESWATSRGMQWIGACDGATRNGAFVASASPFRAASATPGPETAGTLLRVEFDGWTMLAGYFPQGDAKARYFQACSDAAKAVGVTPFLLVGDLNTGNQHADKTPNAEKYACAERFERTFGNACARRPVAAHARPPREGMDLDDEGERLSARPRVWQLGVRRRLRSVVPLRPLASGERLQRSQRPADFDQLSKRSELGPVSVRIAYFGVGRDKAAAVRR